VKLVTENVSDFITFHNANILDPELTANLEMLSRFAAKRNISLTDLSIEKHRMPFINWRLSLASSQI